MKIEINSNIDWVPISFLMAVVLFFLLSFGALALKVQSEQQTIQKAIERGWTIEQVQKLR